MTIRSLWLSTLPHTLEGAWKMVYTQPEDRNVRHWFLYLSPSGQYFTLWWQEEAGKIVQEAVCPSGLQPQPAYKGRQNNEFWCLPIPNSFHSLMTNRTGQATWISTTIPSPEKSTLAEISHQLTQQRRAIQAATVAILQTMKQRYNKIQ